MKSLHSAFLVSICFLMTACIGAGQNSSLELSKAGALPQMTGIDLLGQERPIPDSLKGDVNIVVFAFEREQQKDVNTWIAPADELLAQYEDLKFYEVPLIYEMNGMMRQWVNNGMRSGIPSPTARERTITVYTDREQFLTHMGMRADTIYTLIVDKGGDVLWRSEGVATPESLAAMSTKIEELL